MQAEITPMRQLVRYLEIPLRRPWHVVLPFVAVTLAAVAASYMVTKRYRSSTLLVLQPESLPVANPFIPKPANEGGSANKRLAALAQQVLSRPRLEAVLRAVEPYPEQRQRPLSSQVERLSGDLTVDAKGPDSLVIEYVHTSPAKAKAVVDELAALLIKDSAETRSGQVYRASRFIASQVDALLRQLEAMDDRIRRFKEKNLGRLPEQMAANLAALQRLQLEQQATDEALRAATARAGQLELALAAGDQPAPSELRRLRGELVELRGRYTDEHPDVQTLLARIARLERAAAAAPTGAPPTAVDLTLDDARAEVARLKAKRDDVERRMALFQGRVEAAPRTEQELATLTRDYERVKENYLALLKQKLDIEMAERLDERWKQEQVRVMDPGYLPDRPYFPRRRLFLFGGMLLGLLAGLGLAVASELLDPSVKSPGEIERLISSPLLATLPHVAARGPWRRARARATPPAARLQRSRRS